MYPKFIPHPQPPTLHQSFHTPCRIFQSVKLSDTQFKKLTSIARNQHAQCRQDRNFVIRIKQVKLWITALLVSSTNNQKRISAIVFVLKSLKSKAVLLCLHSVLLDELKNKCQRLLTWKAAMPWKTTINSWNWTKNYWKIFLLGLKYFLSFCVKQKRW